MCICHNGGADSRLKEKICVYVCMYVCMCNNGENVWEDVLRVRGVCVFSCVCVFEDVCV